MPEHVSIFRVDQSGGGISLKEAQLWAALDHIEHLADERAKEFDKVADLAESYTRNVPGFGQGAYLGIEAARAVTQARIDDNIDAARSRTESTAADERRGMAQGGPTRAPQIAKGGGKNGQHANMDKKSAAQQRYEQLKTQYEKLEAARNETPEMKEERDQVKRAMDKAKQQWDFTGENHSQRATGQRR